MNSKSYFTTAAACIKRLSPRLYDQIVKAVFAAPMRTLRELHTVRSENRVIAANAPRFAVDVNARMGLGAHLSWAIGVLAYCEEQGLSPRLLFTNPVYASIEHEDWLDSFFSRGDLLRDRSSDRPLSREMYIPQSMNLLRRLRGSYTRLTLYRAHQLFFSHLNFTEDLWLDAALFCRVNNVGIGTIGVHFRGTDKRLEATETSWMTIANATRKQLSVDRHQIFVATDEPAFLTFMRQEFVTEEVIDLACEEIFDGRPAHLTVGDPFIKGKEAIKTMIVLSRCGLLIRTRSNLSAWAKIINPELPTIVFGEMSGNDLLGFPETLMFTDAK